MIEAQNGDVQVKAICHNIEEAQQAFSDFRPDLVFLDVELGRSQTSFDLLSKISPINFDIIFTTAHNKYAIQAIKFSAIDYLLKPVDELELKSALEKIKNKKTKVDANKVESLLSAWSMPGNQQNKIPLPTSNGYEMVMLADIVYCRTANDHTLLNMHDESEILINLTLRQCESLLSPYRFVRIHHSHIINMNHVKKYLKGKDGIVLIQNNESLTVSRNYKERFLQSLKSV
jgi:two-component system LytT family response regulator